MTKLSLIKSRGHGGQYRPQVIFIKVISKPNVIGRCGLTDRMSLSLCMTSEHHRRVYCHIIIFSRTLPTQQWVIIGINDDVSSSGFTAPNSRLSKNMKGYSRKQSWPYVISPHFLGGTEENQDIRNQDIYSNRIFSVNPTNTVSPSRYDPRLLRQTLPDHIPETSLGGKVIIQVHG